MYPDLGLLVLRIVIGGFVMPHGLLKLGVVGKGGSVAGVAAWFNSMGLRPGLFWAYVAVLAEVGGGLLTVLGLGGPIGPGLLFGDLVVVTQKVHPREDIAGVVTGLLRHGVEQLLGVAGLAVERNPRLRDREVRAPQPLRDTHGGFVVGGTKSPLHTGFVVVAAQQV